MFHITSHFAQTNDQKQASEKLTRGIRKGLSRQVLLGVTGSGKTFTMANVIAQTQRPTLIISHNKTLAGQLYQEMRSFFPDNAVSYFVSYYDYYQPEAYIPQTDTYIEKEAQINDVIDKLRLAATSNILTRKDVIVVASVSCIYNIGSPKEYGQFILPLAIGQSVRTEDILERLIELQYERAEFDYHRGSFRIRGEHIDIYPAYDDISYRITHDNNVITALSVKDPLTGSTLSDPPQSIVIYPAKHYLIDKSTFSSAEEQIRRDLATESKILQNKGRTHEAERLIQKVTFDLEMIREMGYVNGIENYSRYFDGRKPGDAPYSLLDFFKHAYGQNWLVCIDESHMTIPQIRGMYNGDQARKKTLVEYGFRLKAACDNRPLNFDEFYARATSCIYLSATPDEWEIEDAGNHIVEQLVRPTGVIDPGINIRPTEGDIMNLIKEINVRVKRKERVLVTTLTKQTAEDLSSYLKEHGIRAIYLHSDIKTLERTDILQRLRKHEYDVLVGVNLLREGLDLPEVTLVAILDGDKEGFLRSRTALIQTMGRAARNIRGEIIIYADTITKSMKSAIDEVERRRAYQLTYNRKHGIIPRNVQKQLQDAIAPTVYSDDLKKDKDVVATLDTIQISSLTPMDKKRVVENLEQEMKKYADLLNFESAILIRDKVNAIKRSL
ncbi:excinuclease ABC subunit B [Candidatus Roizmanbacteria bacterium RIFCSPLOWO2_02_FULL_43_10]|uniref:UvrABC system protein B n=2 Tax=Candidatus Roizmaniibacteriota TaxID=1752723 RepID=A0A1F7JVQ7_9BACT|nr:MAG: excinuclease ABC subunit B [Candidatus Roizmanbacteria bacterium RIFCSPHIGHO2_02_FULL_43_11]OGK59692.1 MAG: excinuclease ABC subunit B [Candidatus Roizmanbacteria bacterium RIFCSPLOWO2_02_FULL_43_10]